jgi:hypothetical protein
VRVLWGAPRIHGELLKLGFEVAQSTVARYMCRDSRPPSQGWRTFLNNHVDGIAAIDLFVLPTIAFQILYCLVIVRHGRRLWVSFGVTANPIVFGEAHLRRTLRGYATYYYYNVSRTHRSLNKDAPLHRAIERLGAVVSRPVLGGLHQNLIFGTHSTTLLVNPPTCPSSVRPVMVMRLRYLIESL